MTKDSFKIGIQLPQIEGMRGPGVRSWVELRDMSQTAEGIGLDSLWISDHLLYRLEGEEQGRGCWEVWSLLSALAEATSRVELGTLVVAIGWRNPALLAKMVDTVEEISDGRLILGLGAGYHQLEYDAFGFPFDYRVSRFEEAIQIIHGLIRNGEIDFSGRFYSARECELKPRGPRKTGPPILIGSTKPRMLGLAVRYADMWNAYYDDIHNNVQGYKAHSENLDRACLEGGRDPSSMKRTVTVLMADSTADPWWDRLPVDQLEGAGPLVPLSGSVEELAERFLDYRNCGVSHVQICLEPTTQETIAALQPILREIHLRA